MDHIIIVSALIFVYYHISGLATTNILRLTANNSLPVLSSRCVCDHCNNKITPLMQSPIFSYIVFKGKCKYCATPIPLFPLLLELTVLGGMFLITALFRYSALGVRLSFLFYELCRVVVILMKGKRAQQFARQYLIAVIAMLPPFLIAQFVALLYRIV